MPPSTILDVNGRRKANKVVKRRFNQTSNRQETIKPKKSPHSTERSNTKQVPLFIKRKVNKQVMNSLNNNNKNKYANLKIQNKEDYTTTIFEPNVPSTSKYSHKMNLFESTPSNILFKIPSNPMHSSRYNQTIRPTIIDNSQQKANPKSIDKSSTKNLSKDSIATFSKDKISTSIPSAKKSVASFNSTRRSKARILKKLHTDRREVNDQIGIVNRKIPNLPMLNKSIPDQKEDSSLSRNMKKSLRKNLVEKLKTFYKPNIEEKKQEAKTLLNETNKSNFITNSDVVQSTLFDTKNRESVHKTSTKRTSRKNLLNQTDFIKVQDSKGESTNVAMNQSRTSKHSKHLSFSESVNKLQTQGSVTNRVVDQKRGSDVLNIDGSLN